MKYQRKKQIIDAVQYNGSTTQKVGLIAWVQGGKKPDPDALHTCDYGSFRIRTALGTQKCNPGDYVIDDGRFLVASKAYFEGRYEEVKFFGPLDDINSTGDVFERIPVGVGLSDEMETAIEATVDFVEEAVEDMLDEDG